MKNVAIISGQTPATYGTSLKRKVRHSQLKDALKTLGLIFVNGEGAYIDDAGKTIVEDVLIVDVRITKNNDPVGALCGVSAAFLQDFFVYVDNDARAWRVEPGGKSWVMGDIRRVAFDGEVTPPYTRVGGAYYRIGKEVDFERLVKGMDWKRHDALAEFKQRLQDGQTGDLIYLIPE
jgi:hypothetical protein